MTQTTLYWVTYSFWATGLMIPQIEVFLSMKNLQSGEFFNILQSEEESAFNSNSSDGWIIRGHRYGGRLGLAKNFKTPFF